MTIEELKDKLEPLYQFLKDRCYGFILAGSYIIPWIHNKDDIDIAIVFKNEESRLELTSNLDLRAEFKQLRTELQQDSISILSRFPSGLINMAWNYQNKNFVIVKGEIPFDYSYNIFSVQYIDVLKQNIDYLNNEYTKTKKIQKHLYHILTGIYMIQNNSYELTEEQIENINIVHDMEDDIKVKELFDYCKEWLEHYE